MFGGNLASARNLCQPKFIMSINVDKKGRGRPATGKGTPIGVRMHADEIAALDAWIAKQSEPMTRAEAIRRILRATLDSSE